MAIANGCLSLGCRTWRPPNPAGFQSNATYARGLGQHIRPVAFITNIAFAQRLPNNFLRLFTFKYTLAVDICDDHCQRARRPVVAERHSPINIGLCEPRALNDAQCQSCAWCLGTCRPRRRPTHRRNLPSGCYDEGLLICHRLTNQQEIE